VGAPRRIPRSNRGTRGGLIRKGMGMGKARRTSSRGRNLLNGARAYLSGPMDFVASRAFEREHGWRNRVGQFLQSLGVTVFDPWNKPPVKGFDMYGEEDVKSLETRENWTFEDGHRGAPTRSRCAEAFWETMHVDLRMVDTSDFVIAYCPTNIYSVGTPHEVIVARQQRKPVLFVSPPVVFPQLQELRRRLKKDPESLGLLDALAAAVPIKENAKGVPSVWYMPLIGSESFFDSFGFHQYREKYGWASDTIYDEREVQHPPQRPLLKFLAEIAGNLPRKWDRGMKRFVPNDDWLLFEHSLRRRSS
jgi:hypothetical protein